MKILLKCLILTCFFFVTISYKEPVFASDYEIVKNFSLCTGEECGPSGGGGKPLLYNNQFYNTTSDNVLTSVGTIYRVNADYTGLEVLHTFSYDNEATDGRSPVGGLVESGGKLYGVGSAGGSQGLGVIYSINPDGTDYTVLHHFAGGNSDGSTPSTGKVAISGSFLYGSTARGGSANKGVIYKMNLDGSSFTVLYTFVDGASSGAYPYRTTLLIDNGTIYGVAGEGGSNFAGVVYKLGTDGSNFTILKAFEGGVNGKQPTGDLYLYNNILYGTTASLWQVSGGSIFKVGIDGSGFSILHTFVGGANDGSEPMGLTGNQGVLYGSTHRGGDANFGTVYKMNSDGSGFTLLIEFTGTSSLNFLTFPNSAPLFLNDVLYGTVQQNSIVNNSWGGGSGGLYKINTDGTGLSIYNFVYPFADGRSGGELTDLDGKLYGSSSTGGLRGVGTLFRMDPNGDNFEIIHEFGTITSDGYFPEMLKLLPYGVKLYGSTYAGGTNGCGTVFSLSPDGTNYEILHSFGCSDTDGGDVYGSLIEYNGALYGTTYDYGSNDGGGTIYKINPDGTGYSVVFSFPYGDPNFGSYPYASLTEDNDKFYGVTQEGGTSDKGTVFSINPDGTGFSILHSFGVTVGDGKWPSSDLLLYNGRLFGMTAGGGVNNKAVLFSINIDGSDYQILRDFTGAVDDGGGL